MKELLQYQCLCSSNSGLAKSESTYMRFRPCFEIRETCFCLTFWIPKLASCRDPALLNWYFLRAGASLHVRKSRRVGPFECCLRPLASFRPAARPQISPKKKHASDGPMVSKMVDSSSDGLICTSNIKVVLSQCCRVVRKRSHHTLGIEWRS